MSTDYRYTFSGIIYPERAEINLPTIPIRMNAVDAGISGTVIVTSSSSQLSAIFESSSEVNDVFTLKNYVADVVRVIVDGYGYLSGCGYDVEIVKLVLTGGPEPIMFGVDIPVLRPSGTDISVPFTQLMRVFADERSLYVQRSLGDFREAIRSPKDTAFFCYRALESLRQYFVVEEHIPSDKTSWERLRQALAVERATIDYVKTFADPLRHGAGKSISDSERADLFIKTKSIIDRFIVFADNQYKDA